VILCLAVLTQYRFVTDWQLSFYLLQFKLCYLIGE